jgi:serine/threonine-protein kinase
MTTASSRLEQIRAALKGRYDIDRPVGEGGMAVVWLAHDVKHDRRVAVKLLRRELSLSIGAERFAREIAIAAKLNHPNIVGVIDSGVVEAGGVQLPYYVMPLVEGPSVRDLLESEGPMSVDEALRLSAEVADALDFAHARGVVHRDVKPGNILIQAGHALVADFGIARAIDLSVGGAAAATTESVVGTPIYMSPEQCRGDAQVDGRSDIYSLGCVLYEMLAGSPPFEASTPQAVSVAHCNTPVPPLEPRRPGLPASVQALVNRALAKAPADRFATAGEMRRELERLRTRTSAPTQVLAPVPPRRRGWLVAGGVVATLLFTAVAWRLASRPAHPTLPPVADGVVVLSGFVDRSGTMGDEGARLNDALRAELQDVPGLRVVDASEQPDAPPDSLRQRYGADWIVRGAVDRAGDSVGVSIRMVDAASGRELGGAARWDRDVPALHRAVAVRESSSPFGMVRRTLATQMQERRLQRLEPDSGVLAIRERALLIVGNAETAIYELGPSRALAQLATADSLLMEAERRRPDGVVATLTRAYLAGVTATFAAFAREQWPDSTALPRPADFFRRGIALADSAVERAPNLPDGWAMRASLAAELMSFDGDSSAVPRVLADFQQANKLDPNRTDTWLAQASLETYVGDLRSALYAVRRAQEADRLHLRGGYVDYKRFQAEVALERFDSAAVACTEGAARYPSYLLLRTCGAELAGLRSSSASDATRLLVLADSIAGLEKAEVAPSMVSQLRFYAAAVLWRAGLADSGERVYTRATAGWGEAVDPNVLRDAAYARMVRGDADSALTLLARAVRAAPTFAPGTMRDARFAPLRRDPAFGGAMQGIPPSESGPRR